MIHLLSCIGLAVLAQTPAAPAIDFPALGKAFVEARCADKAAAPCALDEVLARHFVRLSIGPFDVEVPHSMLKDKAGLDQLRQVTMALSLAANQWTEWQGGGEFATVDMLMFWPRWMATWKPANASTIAKATSRDMLDVMRADESDRAMSAAWVAGCDSTEKLALVPPDGRQLRMILVPSRLEFMQWVGYSGLIDAASKDANWQPDAAQWTQFWLGWDLVIALEYASWDGFDPSFKASQPMKKVGEGVLAQHVVQQGSFGLLRSCNPTLAEGRHESALAMLLTMDSCGEINTIEGAGGVGTSGAKTKPYSKFIPGGNPKGGTLPGRSAAALSVITESRWRKGHGADGFVGPLRTGQLDGAKAAKGANLDPIATFVLRQEDNSGKHLVHAPFFGPHADDQEYPPAEYLVDFAEFYRAYKAGFLYWLERTSNDPKVSADERWKQLTRGLAGLKGENGFDELVQSVYGLPISAKDGSSDSLEWRFLRHVSASKK